jgi:hypothetical protein
MAFDSIASSLYEVGKAIKKELFQKIVLNQADINSRTQILEQGAAKIEIWNDRFLISNPGSSLTGVDLWRAPSEFTLLDAKVGIFEESGITGILEMDIQKSVDLNPANFSSVFTTKPSLDFSATSDYDESSNAVFDVAEQTVAAGSWLRLDISSIPTPIGGFTVYLIGEFN